MESIDKTKPLISAWEKLPQKKLENWNLQSLDDVDGLEVEPRKSFNDELDKAWTSSKDNVNDVVFMSQSRNQIHLETFLMQLGKLQIEVDSRKREWFD